MKRLLPWQTASITADITSAVVRLSSTGESMNAIEPVIQNSER